MRTAAFAASLGIKKCADIGCANPVDTRGSDGSDGARCSEHTISTYAARCVLFGRAIIEVETATAYEAQGRYHDADFMRREAFNTLEEIGIRNLIVDPGVTR